MVYILFGDYMKFDILKDLSNLSDIGIFVIDNTGAVIFSTEIFEKYQDLLGFIDDITDTNTTVQNRLAMVSAGMQSRNYGGRYICYSPQGLVYFASPIIQNSIHAYTILGGPVLLFDYKDYIELDLKPIAKKPFSMDMLYEKLGILPILNPKKSTAFSEQLFINSRYLSDSEYHIEESIDYHTHYEEYAMSLHGRATNEQQYLLSEGKLLINTLANYPDTSAKLLLNEIIVHIVYRSYKNMDDLRNHIINLISLLSQAAIRDGGDARVIDSLSKTTMSEVNDLETIEEIIIWLSAVLKQYSSMLLTSIESKHSDTIKKAVKYINDNHQNKITLEDIANHVYISPQYLSKIFRKTTGYSIVNYINHIRIEESRELLRKTNKSMTEISMIVGFSDPSYFTKVFSKTIGLNPIKYRTLVRNDTN